MRRDTYNSKEWKTWQGPKLCIPASVLEQNIHMEIMDEGKAIELEKTAKLLIDKATIFTRTSSRGLEGILKDKRLKNQFETGYSNGSYDPNDRRKTEYRIMGVPVRRKHKDRPIYGYLSDNMEVSSASNYGCVTLKLKNDIRFRATFTGEDSLCKGGYLLASPVDAPDYRSWHYSRSKVMSSLSIENRHPQDIGYSYMEVQIHGGVDLSGIEHIHFTMPSYYSDTEREKLKVLAETVKDMGIPTDSKESHSY